MKLSAIIAYLMHTPLRDLLHPRRAVQAQVAEDTCDKHAVYLCEKCFDFSPFEA